MSLTPSGCKNKFEDLLMVLKVAFKKHVSICSCNKKSSVFSSWCTVSIFWVVKYSGDFLFRARFYRWYFLQIMLLHNAMCLLSTVLIFWVSKIVLNLCSAFMMMLCLYFWCHFLKIMVLHQAMCLLSSSIMHHNTQIGNSLNQIKATFDSYI